MFCDITHWEKSEKSSKIRHICFNINQDLIFHNGISRNLLYIDAIYNY